MYGKEPDITNPVLTNTFPQSLGTQLCLGSTGITKTASVLRIISPLLGCRFFSLFPHSSFLALTWHATGVRFSGVGQGLTAGLQGCAYIHADTLQSRDCQKWKPLEAAVPST